MTEPADWIRSKDKTAFILVESFYESKKFFYEGWTLIESSRRTGVYRKNNDYIVVCKGTTPTDPIDIFDDARIAGLLGGNLALEQEARQVVSRIPSSGHVVMTGHSLGGRVALSIAAERDLEAVVFNPAAPFISPIDKGPGASKAVSYHISGDLISSHVSSVAAEVIRIDQGYNPFQVLQAHSLRTFHRDVATYGCHSIDQEDVFITSAVALALWNHSDSESFKRARKMYGKLVYTPIPGSKRSRSRGPDAQMMQVGDNFFYFLSRVDAYDSDVRILQSTFKLRETGFLPRKLKSITTLSTVFSAGEDLLMDISKLSDSVTSLQFISAYADYQSVMAGIDELNRLSGANHTEADLIYSVNENPLYGEEIYESIELQSIGINEEVLGKVSFSTKTPNPEHFLAECSAKIPRQAAELHELEKFRLKSIRAKEVFQQNPFSKMKIPTTTLVKGDLLFERTFSKVIRGTTVAKNFLLTLGKVAGRVTATIFETLVPMVAAADLAYTVYLLGKGIHEGDFSEVLEYTTGVDQQTWRKDADLIRRGPLEYWRPYMESIRPSCERCPPGTALYWNGTTCVRNPCGRQNGKWGIFRDGVCQYTGPDYYLGDDLYEMPTVDLDGGLKEQDEAYNRFRDNEALYRQNTESLGWWDITAPLKEAYKQAYSWDNICPK